MDDFFPRLSQRTPDRIVNIDHERFEQEVLLPLQSGEDFSYRVYDCGKQDFGEEIFVKSNHINIVEGSYSHYFDVYDLRIFMKISEEEQRRRIKERNPDLYERFINEWIPMEERYFREFGIEEKCDIVIEW